MASDPKVEPVAPKRYVEGRCSLCGWVSPVCDQKADPRRTTVIRWFEDHLDSEHPRPYVEFQRAQWDCPYCGAAVPHGTSHDTSSCVGGQEVKSDDET